MFLISLRRVIRSGFFNFWRNGYVSLASVLVMIVTLLFIGSIVFMSVLLNSTLGAIKDKVDINVYFTTTAPEDEILALKEKIDALPEVEETTHLTREQALAAFKARHENDQFTLQALEELDDNPLGAVLNIKAKEPSQYKAVANFLSNQNIVDEAGNPIIDKINYFQNKVAIERLSSITDSADALGFFLTIVLVVISALITFNTIRLAIYISREEIGVMRLVGASTSYIRGPFIITGVIYGAVSAFITLALLYPATYFVGRTTENFFIGLNIFDYYTSNFGQIFLLILGAGVVIGAFSSFLAVRKYLSS